MKPVFNQVTVIEERRKTAEYEGNLKEVGATGYHDLDGITAIGRLKKVVLAGGSAEKGGAGSSAGEL